MKHVMTKSRYVIVFLLISTIFNFSIGSTIDPFNTSIPITTYGAFFTGSKQDRNFSQTAPLMLVTPSNGCSAIKEDLSGYIAVIDSEDCYAPQKVKNAQDAGAVGAFVRRFEFKPPLTYIGDGQRHPDIKIPAGQLSDHDFLELRSQLKEGTQITVEMTPDPCPWDATFGKRALWISYSAIFGTVHFATLIVVIIKLAGVRWSIETSKIKVVCLILQLIVAATRLVHMIDPISTWGNLSETVTFLMSSLHTPFSLISYALLGSYWDSVSQGEGLAVKLTSKTLIGFSVLLLTGEISTWYFRFTLMNTNTYTTIFIVIYLLMIFSTSSYYFYQGMKIVRLLSKNAIGEASKRLQKLNRFILVISGCWFVSAISLIILLAVGVGPYVNTVVYWVAAALLAIASATQVSMFPWSSAHVEESTRDSTQMETFNKQTYPVDSSQSDSGPVLSSTEDVQTSESTYSNSNGFEI